MSPRGHTLARTSGWAAATLVLTLSGRTLAYALQPGLSSDGRNLAAVTGGPSAWAVAAVVVAVAVLTAVTVVWLASLAVNEGQRLEPRAVTASTTISIGAVAAQAAFLFAASSVTFLLLETVIHWRAGARLARRPLSHRACAPRRRSAPGRPFLGGCGSLAGRLAPVGLGAPHHPPARRSRSSRALVWRPCGVRMCARSRTA